MVQQNSKQFDQEVTIEHFLDLLNVDSLPEVCEVILDDKNMRYRFVSNSERDDVLLAIINRIYSDDLVASGEHRLEDWNSGWAENLSLFKKTGDIGDLTPKFIKSYPAIRFQSDYIVAESPSFEFDYFDVLRRWAFLKYFRNVSSVYEFGCGSCQHMPVLSELLPNKRITGLDWADSSMKIIEELGKRADVYEGVKFDMFHPPAIDLQNGSGVLTVGALEQLGGNFHDFLNYLAAQPISVCVHFETVEEFYDINCLSGHLANAFDRKRNYLTGYLTKLKQYQERGMINIIKECYIPFGSMFHDSYSLIVWKPA